MARCPTCGQPLNMQSKGGTARAAKLTKARRKQIARKAAAARWKYHQKKAKTPEAARMALQVLKHSGDYDVFTTSPQRPQKKAKGKTR